jgi:putative transposase
VLDSKSIKAPIAEKRGYDCGEKIVGCEHHVAVDTDGRLLLINLAEADVSDGARAHLIQDGIRGRWFSPTQLFADGACDRSRLLNHAAYLELFTEVVQRSDPRSSFAAMLRRSVSSALLAG